MSEGSARRSFDGDPTEEGDRDESKRRSRNLSEKKRRDQFNSLIHELCSMVSSTSSRKMDKSTVLQRTISFIKVQNDMAVQSQIQNGVSESWKPPFLSNDEFTHLMLEGLDGFIMVISSDGTILYVSETVTQRLGHLPSDLLNSTIFDLTPPDTEDQSIIQKLLMNPINDVTRELQEHSAVINLRLGGLEVHKDSKTFQRVRFYGHFKCWNSNSDSNSGSESPIERIDDQASSSSSSSSSYVFVGLFRLVDCELLREMTVVVNSAKHEFSSRHSLEWKFLFLDHRALPIIGYLPFEVLGTSGYDYYHVDDLEKISTCHEALMQTGEGTSCYYRFLTKGTHWIWLQTRYYITYHQWNSKPEFIVCTHRVVSHAELMKELQEETLQINSESAFVSGPSVPKQAKILSRKTNLPLSMSLKNMNRTKPLYGSGGTSRRNFMRRCMSSTSTLTSSQIHQSELTLPETGQYISSSVPISTNPSVSMCSGSLHTPISIHPQVPQFVHSIQSQQRQVNVPIECGISNISSVMPMPIANFDVNSITCNPFSLQQVLGALGEDQNVNCDSVVGLTAAQCQLQDQLLMKNAELQAKIIRQQEEIRRVSEQLLMTQFNSMNSLKGDAHPAQSLSSPIPQQSPYIHSIHANQSQQLTQDTTTHLQGLSPLFQYTQSSMGYKAQPLQQHDEETT